MTADGAALLLALLFGHFLGDFTPLLTESMRRAKAEGEPLTPIAGHAAVHGLLTLAAVAVALGPELDPLLLAAAAVFVTHFLLDAARARLGARFEALGDPDHQLFWTALGLDQLAHVAILAGLVVLLA